MGETKTDNPPYTNTTAIAAARPSSQQSSSTSPPSSSSFSHIGIILARQPLQDGVLTPTSFRVRLSCPIDVDPTENIERSPSAE